MKKYLCGFIIYFLVWNIEAQKSDFNHIDFNKADKIAMQYKGESIKNLPLLAHRLTHQLHTDVEKFRAIYFWVCHNIKSDYYTTNKVLKKSKKLRTNRSEFVNWSVNNQADFLKRLVNKKETICTGYSILVKELCKLASIESKVIGGYYKGAHFDAEKPFPNHSWNAVLLNNKWYLCDPTLASGYYYVNEDEFIFDYNDGYFLTEPVLFIANHYPENKKWVLLPNEDVSFKNFLERPYVYNKTFEHNITPIFPKKLEQTTSTHQNLDFKLSIAKDKIKDLKIITNNGWKNTIIIPKEYSYKEGTIEFKHNFIKKGLYDVHIKIADDIVTTYTFEVL